MIVVKESQIRSLVRKYLHEAIEDFEGYEYPDEETSNALDGIFADANQEEDDYWQDYYDDMQADYEISWQKEHPFNDNF